MKPNTRINVNGKELFTYNTVEGDIRKRLFDSLLENSKEFIMNDDGSKFKKQMSRFDISEDKIMGRFWHFRVDNESRKILPKVFDYYLEKMWGHWFWSLKGESFKIEYQGCGDEGDYEEEDKCIALCGPDGENTIYHDIKIEANEKYLEIIRKILKEY